VEAIVVESEARPEISGEAPVEAMPEESPAEPAEVPQTPAADGAAVPEPAADPAGPLSDPAAFCRELFEGSVSSFDAGSLFERSYAGKAVSWEGTLKSVDTYSFDLVFGDSPGVKAVFVVATLGSGLYSGSPVQAVVRLPRESMDPLRARLGKRVRFEGTLKSCDGLMRNVYVGDGRIPAG
jgi:hypothetical protein